MRAKEKRRSTLAKVLTLALVVTSIPFGTAAVSSAQESEITIVLSDSGTTVNGQEISTSSEDAVYEGADIVYYETGHDSSYGAGSDSEAHTAGEAAENTVITITQPGTYRVSGTLSKGQLAVDLGEDASDNPEDVVTLILDGADITCTVAPAVIFYNVWESESTTEAGARVTLADDSVNTINGSHVAKIYKEGTTKKLHKYDGAFYSKMTMNISGESGNNGELHITADNEGLDSELHLTVDGGKIWITSQDDGINTNEDDVSIFTVNGGYLYVNAGNGSEGDGIDSNGYITINGGTVITLANATSPDGGLDADHDILINGGTVVAVGVNNEEISTESASPFLQLSYGEVQPSGQITYLTDESGAEILAYVSEKTYQSVVLASPDLAFDTTYYLYNGGIITGVEPQDGLYPGGGSYSGGIRQQHSSDAFGGMTQPGGNVPAQPDGDMETTSGGNMQTQPGGNVPAQPDGDMETASGGNMQNQPEGDVPDRPEGSESAMPGGNAPSQPDGNMQTATGDDVQFQPEETPPSLPEGSEAVIPGGNESTETGNSGSTEFIITKESRSFHQVTSTEEIYEAPVTETPTPGDSDTTVDTTSSPVDKDAGISASTSPLPEVNANAASTATTSASVNAGTVGNTTSGLESDATRKGTVKKTSISKVTRSKNNKKITVKIKKVKKADGFQLRYSTNKKFTKATTKTVKISKKTLKKTISSLKAKKTYYVSVRAYRSVEGSKYYSKWSVTKTVKAK